MQLVILESPYAGGFFTRWRNVRYARRCLKHSLNKGEAPIASHLLYTQVLDDSKKYERIMGVKAGLTWLREADLMVVYEDYGITPGMAVAIDTAKKMGVPVEYRRILHLTAYP